MVETAPCHLLDANVLLALAWPQHTHHAAAHRWFGEVGSRHWATCAITQMAFVRISANPRITVAGLSPGHAAHLLEKMVEHPGHRFWDTLPALTGMAAFSSGTLTGYQQVTDLYLLSLARHHGGRLATFDRGIPQLLAGRERWIELIAS